MPLNETRFIASIFKNRVNQVYIIVALVLSTIFWLVFKSYYPQPNIIFDSYYYIWAANYNEAVSAWPIGYSRFLQLIGIFTHSANALLFIQYLFLQLSFLYFFFSLRYIFQLGRAASLVLWLFFLINPIYIFTANLVLSDTLFLGLSLIWVINLLWIIYRPTIWMLVSQSLLLLIVFSIRHSALYYPIIGGLAIIVSRLNVKWKVGGVLLQFVLIGGFILYTTHQNQLYYGVKQFSPFQGWKMASNALYVYEHVPKSKLKPVPKKFKELDDMVKEYYHSKHDPVSLFHPDPSWGSYYMFMYPSPLLRYKDVKYGVDGRFLFYVPVFSKMGPLYDEYGSFIIKNYPTTFVQYFVIPNMWFYVMPYPEVYFDDYNPFNLQQDTIGKVAQKWFGLKTLAAPKKNVKMRTDLFASYPMVNAFIHIVFVLVAIVFFVMQTYKRISVSLLKCLYLILTLWIVNFFFIVIASASLLRYQLFITVIEFAFAVVFVQLILKEENYNANQVQS